MSIQASMSTDSQVLTISVNGRFDFSAHQDFRNAYERGGLTPRQYVVDLQDTDYIDSSALGMLLLLKGIYVLYAFSPIKIVLLMPEGEIAENFDWTGKGGSYFFQTLSHNGVSFSEARNYLNIL